MKQIKRKGIPVVITALLLCIACSAGSKTFRNIEELKKRGEENLTDAEKLELRMAEDFEQAERYISLGQFSEALSIVQPIINEHGSSMYSDKAYYTRGSIYTNMLNFDRDLERAAAAFRMVIASEPETEFDALAQEALKRLEKF